METVSSADERDETTGQILRVKRAALTAICSNAYNPPSKSHEMPHLMAMTFTFHTMHHTIINIIHVVHLTKFK